MNNIKLDQTDLAITSTLLKFMQDSLAEIQTISKLGGDNYILSGCTLNGTYVSAGYVVINGELLEFKPGNISTYVLIREVEETIEIREGSYTKKLRYVEFGSGVNQISWNSLKRIKNIQEIEHYIEDVLEEIGYEALERQTQDNELQSQINSINEVINGLFKTGMIMPFMGSAAPSGWILCNGTAIPDDAQHAALRALVGTNTPNLNGYGLTGAGTRSLGSLAGNDNIILNASQLPAHKHGAGTFQAAEAGGHYHRIAGEIMQKDGSSTKTVAALDTGADPNYGPYYKNTDGAGNHWHSIIGESAAVGNGSAIDIRNKTIAVNFIIKI